MLYKLRSGTTFSSSFFYYCSETLNINETSIKMETFFRLRIWLFKHRHSYHTVPLNAVISDCIFRRDHFVLKMQTIRTKM